MFDAFYMVPLNAAEQCYYVASYDGKFYVWLRLAPWPQLVGQIAGIRGPLKPRLCFG